MKSLLVLFVCFGISLTAHASDVNYAITGGTFSPTGTFSGSFLIDPATYLIDSATISATIGSNNYSFFEGVNDSPIPGLETLTDASGDVFDLLINANSGPLAINTLALFGPTADTRLILATGARYDATGGTIAATPEPSSLLLLGTGALGLAGSFRRRFLNA